MLLSDLRPQSVFGTTSKDSCLPSFAAQDDYLFRTQSPVTVLLCWGFQGLQIRYNHDFEAMAKSIALVHGWLEDSKV